MKSTVLWSITLFSSISSARQNKESLPPCAQICLQPLLQSTNCADIRCICQRKQDLQNLFHCVFINCNAVEYSPALKTVTGNCITSSAVNTVQDIVASDETDTNDIINHHSPMQLEAARHMGHVGDVGSGGQGSLVPETRILSPNTFSENPDGHHPLIGLNINLHYDDGNTDGSASPPRVVTMTQTVTVPQAGAGSGSGTGSYAYGGYQGANAGGSGAGSYDFGAGSGSGVGGKGAYGAGAGNGGSDPAAYGPPGGGNGQTLTVIETTTICPSSAQQSLAGGYGNGGGGSPPCPAGNGNGNGNGNGACQPSQPALQGPLVETVFILGTPSSMAIAPTSCSAGAGNGNGDDGSQYAAQAAPAPPPPPPPPPVYVTITQTVAAPPPPPSPAPVPLAAVSFDPPAYAPPNTVAYYGAKGAGLQQQVADEATTSFYTAITAAPHFQQSGAAGAYGDPPDSASAATANGSNSPADSDGAVAPIPAIPPSIWGAGPAQVTAAKAAQDGPSLVILSAALGFILLQALFLTF